MGTGTEHTVLSAGTPAQTCRCTAGTPPCCSGTPAWPAAPCCGGQPRSRHMAEHGAPRQPASRKCTWYGSSRARFLLNNWCTQASTQAGTHKPRGRVCQKPPDGSLLLRLCGAARGPGGAGGQWRAQWQAGPAAEKPGQAFWVSWQATTHKHTAMCVRAHLGVADDCATRAQPAHKRPRRITSAALRPSGMRPHGTRQLTITDAHCTPRDFVIAAAMGILPSAQLLR